MVFTSPLEPGFVFASAYLALVASLFIIPGLALALGEVERRPGGAAPGDGPRVAGAVPLKLGAAAGLLAAVLVRLVPAVGFVLGIPALLAELVLVVVGVALTLASSGSRSALRAALRRGPGTLPPTVRLAFGFALAAGGSSIVELHQLAACLRGEPVLMHGGEVGLVPMLSVDVLPPMAVWAVGRASMVVGTIGLLRARTAGTLVYSAGLALSSLSSYSPLFLPRWIGLGALAVDVAVLVLAWRYVRGGPAPSPAPAARPESTY